MINEYHKSKLNKKCQNLYEQMVNSFERMDDSVECKSASNQDVSDTYVAVYNDHPEFFYLSHAPKIAKKIGFLGNSTTLISNNILGFFLVFHEKKFSKVTYYILLKEK